MSLDMGAFQKREHDYVGWIQWSECDAMRARAQAARLVLTQFLKTVDNHLLSQTWSATNREFPGREIMLKQSDISRRDRFRVWGYITDRPQPNPSTPHFSITTSIMPHTYPHFPSCRAAPTNRSRTGTIAPSSRLAHPHQSQVRRSSVAGATEVRCDSAGPPHHTPAPALGSGKGSQYSAGGLAETRGRRQDQCPRQVWSPPLHSAVICGSTAAVTVLLQNGANPHVRNSDGWAALHLAAITGHCRIVGLLLDHGADMAARSSSLLHKLPFHYAVLLGHVAVTEIFLARGADVNGADSIGMTVAQKAAVAGHSGVVKVLFGDPAVAMAITQSAEVVQLVPLVGMETSIAMRHFWYLVETEAHAARFRGQ